MASAEVVQYGSTNRLLRSVAHRQSLHGSLASLGSSPFMIFSCRPDSHKLGSLDDMCKFHRTDYV
jgi:hypothetical protein